LRQLVEWMVVAERVGAICLWWDCEHNNMLYGCELEEPRTMKRLLLLLMMLLSGIEDMLWNKCANSCKLILLWPMNLGRERRKLWLRDLRVGCSKLTYPELVISI